MTKKPKKGNAPAGAGPKFKKTRTAICRDCSALEEVDPHRFGRVQSPRCMRCGGILDRKTPKPWLERLPDGTLTRRE